MPAELHSWTLACIVDNTPHDLKECAAFTPQAALEQGVLRAKAQKLEGTVQALCLDTDTNCILQHRFWGDCNKLEFIPHET